ncbi:MAG: pentapeptide repeat-containing protein [Bryobacteraceae bacterium]
MFTYPHDYWTVLYVTGSLENLMVNAIHFELLTGGVEQWNAWRAANYIIQPDLSQSDLKGLDLKGANFFDADLSSADLTGANLQRCDLSHSRLRNTKLVGVLLYSGRPILSATPWRDVRKLLIQVVRHKGRSIPLHGPGTISRRRVASARSAPEHRIAGTPTRRQPWRL